MTTFYITKDTGGEKQKQNLMMSKIEGLDFS